MKKIHLCVSSVILLCITTATLARNGIYLTLEGGWANQTGLPSASKVGATSVNTSMAPTALRVGVGYNHDLLKNIGIGFEMGLAEYGKTTYTFNNGHSIVKSGTSEYLITGQYHLLPYHTDIVGKIGGIRLQTTASGLYSTADHTCIRPAVILGGAYNFTPHIAGTLSYGYISGGSVNNLNSVGKQATALDLWLAGLRFTF